MSNHLIIGLGGTGGKIIRAFRRTVYEEFRRKAPVIFHKDDSGRTVEMPHSAKLGYLYVDSDPELMEPNHPSWKIPGDTLQLDAASQLCITGANLLGVIENPGAHPHISPWLGSSAEWRDILNQIVGAALGGQKRRLGRFLFACRANDAVEGFVAKLRGRVEELRKISGETDVTFHICAGLAGGTGSGTLIDVITQIRTLYTSTENRVVLYCLLPEEQPPPNWDTGNYHANGYGALVELNALSVGAYHPHNVADQRGERVNFRSASGTPLPPFSGAYLFTTDNDKGRVLNQQKDEVAKMVGSFLFQKIVVAHDTPWSGQLRHMENGENGDGAPESIPGVNIPQRSKRFLTFGIKRLTIPEEEIREFIYYSFARSAVNQLQYNNWSPTQGYLELPTNEAFAQLVTDEGIKERWKMADSYLNLERGILPSEEVDRWGRIADDWKTAINGFLQVVMRTDDSTWMTRLTELVDNHFNTNWRGMGVSEFFRMKEGDRKDQAKEIRAKLEADLWQNWVEGEWAMGDIIRLLQELRRHLDSRADACLKEVAKHKALIEDTKSPTALASRIRENKSTWAKIGPLSAAFGKRKNIIQAQAGCYEEWYVAMNKVESWGSAEKLLKQIILEIDDLVASIQTIVALFTDMVKGDSSGSNGNRFVGLAERIEARCKPNEKQDLSEQVVKLYNPDDVRSFTDRLLRDADLQRAQTRAVRIALVNSLGEGASFGSFRKKITRGTLMDLLEDVCNAQTEQAHNNLLATEPSLQRLMGANIVDILCKRFSGNSLQLRDYIRNLVESAGNYMRFDPMEEGRNGPGASPVSATSSYAVLLPEGAEHPGFLTAIKEAFQHAYPHGISFFTGVKATEITMVGIRNLFPLRYSSQIAFLRKKYEDRILRVPRSKLEVHSEADGTGWPPVFLPEGTDIRKGLRVWLLLGKAMGRVQEMPNGVGITELCLTQFNDRGVEIAPTVLGNSEDSVIENGDPAIAYLLEEAIKRELAGKFLHSQMRATLRNALDDMARELAGSEPNIRAPKRIAFSEAATAAEAILKMQ